MNIFLKLQYKGDKSVKNGKGDSPLKVPVQIALIILLHGFDVCISIERLNRYVINCCIYYVCKNISLALSK